MWRRCLLAVAVVLGSMPGCGMAVRKLDEETLAAATTINRSYPESPHRVALAAFEVMRAELASAEFAKDSEFAPNPGLVKRDGTRPKEGELPPNFPAFWLEWKNNGQPVRALVTLKAAHFAAKDDKGRPIEVGVVYQPGETLLTVHIDKFGDRMFSQWLMDQVANRLAHPAYPPGSLEEAMAFKAFFGGVESREALPSIRKKADAASSVATSRSR
jgi:hypothetical protein